MAKLEISYSKSQLTKPRPTSLEGAKIDPYYSSVAGSGFSKLGSYVDKIIQDSRVQNDKNRIRKLKIDVDKIIRKEYAKYSTSSDTADVNTFLENTDWSKYKKTFKKENKYVQNGIEAYLLNAQKDTHWRLLTEITSRHVKESELGDHMDLDKLTLLMGSNDIITSTKASNVFERWFVDPTNTERYGAVALKKLYDDKLAQANRYRLEFGIKNDPFEILRNPKKLTDELNVQAASEVLEDAKKNAVNHVVNLDWDALYVEEASIAEKINNFSEIIVRMNTWKGDEKNWRAQLPTVDDLHDMFDKDQINSAQLAVLLDFYTNPNKLSDQSIKDFINAQITLASNVEEIDNLEKMVVFDQTVAMKLNVKDISKFKAQFEKHRENFQEARNAKIYEEKVSNMMGKVNSLGGMIRTSGSKTSEEKDIRENAENYYNDLVYNKKIKPADAFVQTIDAFTTEKNAPVIYNVANLTSIKLRPPKANKLNPEEYFNNYRNEIAQAYKNGKIDIQVFMEDLAAMDVIEDVFKVRLEIYESKGEKALNFAFGTTAGQAIKSITDEPM